MPPPGRQSKDLKPQPNARRDFRWKDVEKVVGQASSINEIVDALSRRGCLNLTSDIDFNKCSELPLAGGGYCDIFRGELHSGTVIAIKSLRVFDKPGMESNRKKLLKHAAKELYHWSKLRHPNILPLKGLALFREHISMISEWVENGNLTDYLGKHPDVDRIPLCIGICEGLCYIHEGDMVHGDLKGANIMISSTGIAMIADFGNAHLKELTLKFTNTTSPGLSLRWAAPELLSEDENNMSKSSDVYAYGMTALETLTGKLPFEGKSERSLLASLARGNLLPTRPESGISDELWEILTSCWAQNPEDRPSIVVVRRRLRSTGTSVQETLAEYNDPPILFAPRLGYASIDPSPPVSDSDSVISGDEIPDAAEEEIALVARHREALEWAEQDASEKVGQGDHSARYIFNGFPAWVNWDLFTRLENDERRENGHNLLSRVTSKTPSEQVEYIYGEWRATRDKWVDRFWDPGWAQFMHDNGGPIQRELAAERQTPWGQALEAAREYQREIAELPLAKREFSRGYLWDRGYVHPDWRWIKQKAWQSAVEHENDERRASGRAPLPRYYSEMSAEDWRDIRDMWHIAASKWAEKRKDLAWLERDRQEGITPDQRFQLEQQFFKLGQQHKALSPEERDKIRHDSAMEVLARRQETFNAHQLGTPQISKAEATKRRLAQKEIEEPMRTHAPAHARLESSIGHAGQPIDAYGMHGDSDQYDSSSSDDRSSLYLRPANGFPPPPGPDALPDWMRQPKTFDPPSSSMSSIPGHNPSVPSIGKAKKTGILKGILKRTLAMQRRESDNNDSPPPQPIRADSQERPGAFGGMFGHDHSRSEVSLVDNPWAGALRNAYPVAVQPIRFDRAHPFSMTSPNAIDFEGKLYPSAIHLWHALRFLRRPAKRGPNTEESWRPEIAEGIRQSSEPELMADQWANTDAIGRDGTIMRSLQRPDWEEVKMQKIDDVLGLKFTQHPSLGQLLLSTNPAELLYMWEGPWGAGYDLKGPNLLGEAVMRCRERLLAAQRRS